MRQEGQETGQRPGGAEWRLLRATPIFPCRPPLPPSDIIASVDPQNYPNDQNATNSNPLTLGWASHFFNPSFRRSDRHRRFRRTSGVAAFKQAFSDPIRIVQVIAIPFGAVTCVASWFVGDFRSVMTYRVDAPLQALSAKAPHERA